MAYKKRRTARTYTDEEITVLKSIAGLPQDQWKRLIKIHARENKRTYGAVWNKVFKLTGKSKAKPYVRKDQKQVTVYSSLTPDEKSLKTRIPVHNSSPVNEIRLPITSYIDFKVNVPVKYIRVEDNELVITY